MKKNINLFLGLIGALVLCANGVDACTGIKLTPKDGSVVHGRTLEFGTQVETSIVVVPRGYEFRGTTPNGPGMGYQAKYGVVGVIAFSHVCMMDGLNEEGLAVGTFYFPGFAEYGKLTSENQKIALSPIDLPNWILTQFSTVEEVKKNLSSVVVVPTVVKEWGPTTPPFHYIVYDKTGKSLVIEPRNGKLLTYDNPLGTFTNSPYFEWHMENLRNYINLTNFNAKPFQVDGLTFAPFGQGSGMVGLPGDFTPPSRFVRAAIYSIAAVPSYTADDAIGQMFHILNQFDIPIGVARSRENGVIYSDYTQFTCVRDPQAFKYYFKTYDDQTVKVVDLQSFDLDVKSIKKVSSAGKGSYVDISSTLK